MGRGRKKCKKKGDRKNSLFNAPDKLWIRAHEPVKNARKMLSTTALD
jgi:hypothetical protein